MARKKKAKETDEEYVIHDDLAGTPDIMAAPAEPKTPREPYKASITVKNISRGHQAVNMPGGYSLSLSRGEVSRNLSIEEYRSPAVQRLLDKKILGR